MKSIRTFWQQTIVPYPLEWLLSTSFFLYSLFFSHTLRSGHFLYWGEWTVALMCMQLSVATVRLYLKNPIRQVAYWCAPLFVCWFNFLDSQVVICLFWYMGLTRQYGNRPYAQHLYASFFELLRVLFFVLLFVLLTGIMYSLFRAIDPTDHTLAVRIDTLMGYFFFSFLPLIPLLSQRKTSTRLAQTSATIAYRYVLLPLLAIQTLVTYYFFVHSFIDNKDAVLQVYGVMLLTLFTTGFFTAVLSAAQDKAIRLPWQRLFGVTLLPLIAMIWWEFYTMMPNGPVYRIHWAYLLFSLIVCIFVLLDVFGKKSRLALFYPLIVLLWGLFVLLS